MQSPFTFGGRVAVCALALATPAHADGIVQLRTFKVNATSDGVDANPGDGICNTKTDPNAPPKCTLRAAVMEGNTLGDGWKIEVELVPGNTYALTIPGAPEELSKTGDLDILRPMRIGVPHDSASKATIDATGQDRAFQFIGTPGISLLHGLHIVGGGLTNGGASQGAAVYSSADVLNAERLDVEKNALSNHTIGVIDIVRGKFTLLDSRIHHNGKVDGGGVEVQATAVYARGVATEVIVDHSTIDNNAGYGIYLIEKSQLAAISSTFSSNAFHGVHLENSGASIISCTLIENAGLQISAVADADGPALVELSNSIISSAFGGACGIDSNHVTFVTQSNIYSDKSCVSDTFFDNSLHNTQALLSGLGNFGGLTPTHMPFPESPAIDRAPASLCMDDATDQRGMPRPVPYEPADPPRCDTGAVELKTQAVGEPPPVNPALAILADGFEGDD